MAAGMIELAAMPQLAEARDKHDDWTGVGTKAERRRRQNRLNQRALRRRKAERVAAAVELEMNSQVALQVARPELIPDPCAPYLERPLHMENLWKPPVPCPIRPAISDPHDLLSLFTPTQLVRLASQSSMPTSEQLKQPKTDIANCYSRTTDLLTKQLWPLSADHLISMIHYNVHRGLIRNLIILDLFVPVICEHIHTFDGSALGSLPATLVPTAIQAKVLHPAWIDIFPSPRLRDNIIRRIGSFDEDELCCELVGEVWEGSSDGESSTTSTRAPEEEGMFTKESQGLVLWGEPWDLASWEVTPGFLSKWTWILEGCPEILRSTNYWRSVRGEPALVEELE